MSSPKKRYSPFYIRPPELTDHDQQPPGTALSLIHACRSVIVTHLERFPAEAFTIIDSDEWDALVELRYENTKPRRINANSTNDGRLVAAVSDKFLTELEAENDHLAESSAADRMLWKYCVEFKFRRGGLTRPVELELPWPLLVDLVKERAESLADPELRSQAIEYLVSVPMSIALLRDTGVGKTIKKAVKKLGDLKESDIVQLRELLARWMAMVEKPRQFPPNEDLALAESCQSWRQLFSALRDRNEKSRSSQGKRMREIRKNLAKSRPKMMKVRPASAKQEALLNGVTMYDPADKAQKKVLELRREARIQTAARNRVSPVKKPSFADAVARASGKTAGNGKRVMRMPNGPPRQFMKRTKK